MFDHEIAHNQLIERIASLERMLALLLPDDQPIVDIPRRDSVQRAAALSRQAHYKQLRQ